MGTGKLHEGTKSRALFPSPRRLTKQFPTRTAHLSSERGRDGELVCARRQETCGTKSHSLDCSVTQPGHDDSTVQDEFLNLLLWSERERCPGSGWSSSGYSSWCPERVVRLWCVERGREEDERWDEDEEGASCCEEEESWRDENETPEGGQWHEV